MSRDTHTSCKALENALFTWSFAAVVVGHNFLLENLNEDMFSHVLVTVQPSVTTFQVDYACLVEQTLVFLQAFAWSVFPKPPNRAGRPRRLCTCRLHAHAKHDNYSSPRLHDAVTGKGRRRLFRRSYEQSSGQATPNQVPCRQRQLWPEEVLWEDRDTEKYVVLSVSDTFSHMYTEAETFKWWRWRLFSQHFLLASTLVDYTVKNCSSGRTDGWASTTGYLTKLEILHFFKKYCLSDIFAGLRRTAFSKTFISSL